jgi:hypothetical protein
MAPMSDAVGSPVSQLLARLDQFTEEELVHLNRLVVERLRLIRQVRDHQAMIQFRVGQRVTFTTSAGRTVRGVLTRYNRKSVSVLSEQGQSWTVAPSLIRADPA